jgi:hypothetical protein
VGAYTQVGVTRQARFHGGEDMRARPYALFHTPIDHGPVRLR